MESHGRYERRVLLLDLDLTLFDYSTTRRKAAERAVSSLSLNVSGKEVLELYKEVERHSRGFEAIGFPNFKQLWNSPRLYAVLMALASMDKRWLSQFFAKIQEFEEKIGKLEERIWDDKKEKQEQIVQEVKRFETWFKKSKLPDKLKELADDKSAQEGIQTAVKEFERLTTPMSLFDNVEYLIRSLHAVGIEHYIVTEGNEKIQMEKVRKLGLCKLIEPQRVLVVNSKTSSSFFQVLEAIQNSPNHPKSYLRKRRTTTRPAVGKKRLPIKLAIIGDRYDKDIAPLIELFGNNVIAIRLVFGKYAKEYSLKYLRRNNLPLPSLVTSDLSEAREFLLKQTTWSRIKAVVEPRKVIRGDNRK